MTSLTDRQIDAMLADTADVPSDESSPAADLAGHVKALASEVGRYRSHEGAHQQATHMAKAACKALDLDYEHTSPSEIEAAIRKSRREAKDLRWRLAVIRRHLTWNDGSAFDHNNALGIIDGTVKEPGGECGCCKAICHPNNNVCEKCTAEDE